MGFDDEEEERKRKEFDGLRPDEEVGPEESECGPERAQQTMDEQDDESDPHDSDFSAEDEFHDAFPVEPVRMGMDPNDGMPVPLDGNLDESLAVPFSYETQLCVEDAREYVELFSEEIAVSYSFDLHEKCSYEILNNSRFHTDGRETPRRTFKPEEVERRFGHPVVLVGGGLIVVRPVRPKCKFLKRQVLNSRLGIPFGQFGHQEVFRLCTARRSNGGAYMTLRDQGIYQCDFRDPPCPKSTQEQDQKDLIKLRTRPDKDMVPAFGIGGDGYRKD
jgi:hypothetical protein